MASRHEDQKLLAHFAPIAKALEENEDAILAEISAAEGRPADLGGYYFTDPDKTASVMRASQTLLRILS